MKKQDRKTARIFKIKTVQNKTKIAFWKRSFFRMRSKTALLEKVVDLKKEKKKKELRQNLNLLKLEITALVAIKFS